MKLIYIILLLSWLVIPLSVFAGESANFKLPETSYPYGGRPGYSENHTISKGIINAQPVGTAVSDNYNLQAETVDSDTGILPSCGVIINADSLATGSGNVTLGLICSSPNGCTEVAISSNGYSWTSEAPHLSPRPYATSTTWPLPANDGEKRVYVKFKDSLGNWSLPCSDAITLDTTSPNVTASPVGGTFLNPVNVTLTAGENATIHYTVDGSTPTAASQVYSGAVAISADTTLRYMAIDSSGNDGPVGEQKYEVCNGSNFTIQGMVKDANTTAPIPLTILTLSNGKQVTVNPDGSYAFTALGKGYYTITSVKVPTPGYVTYQKEMLLCKNATDNPKINDIILSRQDTAYGRDTQSGYSADGVNTSTGNFAWAETDLEIPGRGIPFAFKRGYNSQDSTSGILGYGWNHNLNTTLVEESATVVTVRWGDGKSETWSWDGTKYLPRYGVFNTLTKNPDGTYKVQQKDMLTYHFNAARRLSGMTDENGNGISYAWTGSNLTSVTDTVGRTLALEYDTNTPVNRLTRILDPIGRSITFSYDGSGNMVSSTDLGGYVTTYTYDPDHQLLTITDPRGSVIVTNSYDNQRRVISSQKDALGAQTLYSYDEAKKTTQIIDPYGNISYHTYDDQLRLVKETDSRGYSSQYEYNERGSLKTVTDKRGNVTGYEYDANGNVLTKTELLGRITRATFDANNNPLTKTDPNGNVTTYTYEGGNLKTVKYPDTPDGQYAVVNDYDQYGQLIRVTDARGNATEYGYDVYGNRVWVKDAKGNESEFYFDLVGRKSAETHPLGRGMLYEYDSNDHLVSVTDALGGTSVFTYDAKGNKTEHLDARANRTLFAYDAKDHLISRTLPMGEKEEYTWDLMDRRIAVKNARGAISSLTYDPLGNVLQETDHFGSKVSHEYDGNGNRIRTIDARGNATIFVYDELNRLKEKTNPLGQKESYTYDLNGNRLTVTNHLGQTVTSTYDTMNRLKTVKDHLDHTVTNDYDELGRLVKVTDGRSNPTTFEYDELGRLTKVTDAENGIVTAEYDPLGNRTRVTDTRGKVTTYEYDVLNRLVREADQLANEGNPLGSVSAYGYDGVGNLTLLSDATGTTSFSYDENNRLTGKTYPVSGSVSYGYDENGNRTSVTDQMGTIGYSYDLRDRVSAITDPFGNRIGYSWDANNNRTAIAYPGNREVYYTYDPLNRLSRVQDWSGIATTYTYDDAGRLERQVMGNGATVTYGYDAAGRLTDKEDRTAGGVIIAQYHYGLDENGNRTSMTMNQPLVPKPTTLDVSFTYDSANRILDGGGATYSHDGKGNRTGKSAGAVTTQYAYNQENRLTRVLVNSALQQEYRYDSDGRRFASVEGGVETRYLLDLAGGMETLLAEMTAANGVKRYYVHGDGLLYSVDGATNERLFYHYDPLGSTVALTDSSGAITDKYAYLPFGELNRSEAIHDNRFTYVGKYGVMNEPNGLYFMRARFYDPETKRFMGVDPVKGEMQNPQTLNGYGYSANNPLLYSDPKGEVAQIVAGVLIGVAEWVVENKIIPVATEILCSSCSAEEIKTNTRLYQSMWSGGTKAFNLSLNVALGTGVAAIATDMLLDAVVGGSLDVIDGSILGTGTYDSLPPKISSVPDYAKQDFSTFSYVELRSEGLKSGGNSLPSTPAPQSMTTPTTPQGVIRYNDSTDSNSWSSIRNKAQARRDADRIRKQVSDELRKAKKRDREKAKFVRERQRQLNAQREREQYLQAATELSKYSVLIMDMNRLPAFNSTAAGREGGLYGKK